MARATEPRGNGTRRPARGTRTATRATAGPAEPAAAPERQAVGEAPAPAQSGRGSLGPGGKPVGNEVAEAMATSAAATGVVASAALAEQAARFGDPLQRTQEQVAALIREQVQDSAETVRRLMTCTSLPAAVSLQVEATGRTMARMVAHGQAMAALGNELVRAFDPTRR